MEWLRVWRDRWSQDWVNRTTRVSRNLRFRGSLEGQTDCDGVGRMALKYWREGIAVSNSILGRVTPLLHIILPEGK